MARFPRDAGGGKQSQSSRQEIGGSAASLSPVEEHLMPMVIIYPPPLRLRFPRAFALLDLWGVK
jgi:hypothetical protein